MSPLRSFLGVVFLVALLSATTGAAAYLAAHAATPTRSPSDSVSSGPKLSGASPIATPIGVQGRPSASERDSILAQQVKREDGASSVPPLATSVRAGTNPFTSTYDAVNGYLYAVNEGSANVTVIDGTASIGSVPVGAYPGFATVDDRNGYVYVPGGSGGALGQVTVINGTAIVGTIAVGSEPWSATYDSGNGYVYVTNFNSSNVTVIDSTTVVGSVSIGTNPTFAAIDSETGYIYITCLGPGLVQGEISIINDTKLVTTLQVGSPVFYPIFDRGNGYIYVSGLGGGITTSSVFVINGTTIVGTVGVGLIETVAEHDLVYDNESGLVYVASYNSNNVSVIDGKRLVGSVPVGKEPASAAYDSVNGCIYVSNNASNNVSVISGMKTIKSVPVGIGPTSVTVDSGSGYVYVTNPDSSNVSIVFPEYGVTFMERGLPPDSEWEVQVDGGPPIISSATSLWFIAPSGEYTYGASTTNQSYSALAGSFTVTSSAEIVEVTFSPTTFPVVFVESGLSSGTSWSVNLAGSSKSTTGLTITFLESDGTYHYSIGLVPGWASPNSSGLVEVRGGGTSLAIEWGRVSYSVTFSEMGLPPSTTWEVSLNGTQVFGNGNIQMQGIVNGTYGFSIGMVNGYSASPSKGTISVSGGQSFQPIVFKHTGSKPTLGGPAIWLGLTATEWYVGFAGILAIVVAATTVITIRRRNESKVESAPSSPSGKEPRQPPSPPYGGA
jgi:YVTN family beta-propeller protein